MNIMAKFLSALFKVLGYFSPILAEIGDSFYTAYKELCKGTDAEHAFTKYVLCPKCNQLYKYDDCKENEREVIRSRTCSYVEFPYHPHLSRREPCGFPLLKTIEIKKTDRGNKVLRPFKVYCYQSLQKCLRKLFKLEEFVRSCSTWKQNQWNNGVVIKDIYEGRIWKEFLYKEGSPFLEEDYSIAFILNVSAF